ncbi:MAG: hypothetical protein M1838_000297 [Thelocarpon superellum]|nr:MAG: hypothetical protein M1838_000297 [Thelocarpon superellum]
MDAAHQRSESAKDLFHEMGRLRVSADEEFLAQLDRQGLEREKAHRAALDRAAAEHDRVRQSAEVARLRFEHEMQKELKRRQDEERHELDKIRHERAARELAERRKELEAVQQREAEQRAEHAEIERQIAQEKAKTEAALAALAATKQRRHLDEARKAAEEERRRAERVAAEQPKQHSLATATPPPVHPQPALSPPPPPPAISLPALANGHRESAPDNDSHQEYRQIHQRLKQLRRFMMNVAKQNAALKRRMGDMRREIRKSVGQCTEGKGANRGLINKIVDILREARDDRDGPPVDVRQFLVASSSDPGDVASGGSDGTLPGLLVYLINIFAKAIIAQFISEASVSPKAADPVGIVAVQIFASNDFRWRGRSLIDIMMAKFHVVCPVLWGVNGDERTAAGKARLGWWREETDGPWVSEQRHNERMTGLGAGFAAIALRNFAKSKLRNPYPNIRYWQALQCIVSVPPPQATSTHFVVLKAMVENYENRFLELYGSAAKAALRKALVDFPAQTLQSGGPGAGVAARAVAVLPDVLQRNRKLTLAS